MAEFDYGSMATDYIFSLPITHMIDEDAARGGLNPNDPKRRALAEGGSLIMGTLVGATLGGPLGFVAGLMGYCMGMASKPAGESAAPPDATSEGREILEAGVRALERVRDEIDDDLAERLYNKIVSVSRRHGDCAGYSAKRVLKVLYDGLYEVDRKAANLWAAFLAEELPCE
jgi:hypothetical protein